VELRRGDTSRLRRQNAVLTMRLLREQGAMGLTELATQSGLSRPTVEGIVDSLLDAGWLFSHEPETGQVGRPRRLVEFRADAGHVMGVDIGSVTVRPPRRSCPGMGGRRAFGRHVPPRLRPWPTPA
jgi:predicted transcriptional regulator